MISVKLVRGVYGGDEQKEMFERLGEVSGEMGLLWYLGVSTGFRVSDLLGLRYGDLTGEYLEILESKTGKRRRVRLLKGCRREVNKRREVYDSLITDYVFVSRKRNRPVSRQYVHRVLKRVGEEMGMDGIGSHSMRKTYAYNLLLRAKNVNVVQQFLNHKYMTTTILYLIDGILYSLPKIGKNAIKPGFVDIKPHEKNRC